MVTYESSKSEIYIADGLTTTFEFGFYAASDSDLRVSVDGVDAVILSSSLADVGGSVTLFNAPAADARVVVYRETEVSQETDLVHGAAFYPENLEKMADKLTLVCQEIKEELSRCTKTEITGGGGGIDIAALEAVVADCRELCEIIELRYDGIMGAEYPTPQIVENASADIDYLDGNVHKLSVSGTDTVTLTVANIPSFQTLLVHITKVGGAYVSFGNKSVLGSGTGKFLLVFGNVGEIKLFNTIALEDL